MDFFDMVNEAHDPRTYDPDKDPELKRIYSRARQGVPKTPKKRYAKAQEFKRWKGRAKRRGEDFGLGKAPPEEVKRNRDHLARRGVKTKGSVGEATRRSASHRKYKEEQSTAREGWMDLKAYRKHLKRRGVKTKGTGEGLSRGRGGPESVERGESGDPEARGGSASYRRAGGSAKASRKIRARKTRKDLHRGSAFSYDESKHDTRTNNPELKRFGESKGKSQSTAKKSKAKVYDSITDALKNGYLGQIFSTKASKRLYVITKRKWGTDPEQEVSGRVAKGFSPGSIPSSFSDVKGYAVRTMSRHGKQTAKKFQSSKYWKGKKGKD